MRIAIAGGNGFIGGPLTTELTGAGHEVVWLSHRPGRAATRDAAEGPVREVAFDHRDASGPWVEEVGHADAVINVSGYPISSRWNDRTQGLIRESRVPLTRALVDAVGAARGAGGGPEVLVNASGAGIYGDRGDDVLDESEPPGSSWLSRLAEEWETEAYRAQESGLRVITVRTGVVLGPEGALPRLVLPMRLFFGGPLGSGRQWFPWIHQADIVGIYRHAVETRSLEGAVNAVAPGALTMRDFARTLGHVLHRPSWFPTPRFAIAVVVGKVVDELLASQRASVEKVLDSGYEFRFPDARDALADLLA